MNEYLICTQLEQLYLTITQVIDFVISAFPDMIGTILKYVKAFENIILLGVAVSLQIIENYIKQLKKFIDSVTKTGVICGEVLRCQVLFDYLTYKFNPSGVFKDPITGQDITPFDWFEKYVCGSGAMDVVHGLIEEIKQWIGDKIEEIKSMIKLDDFYEMLNGMMNDYLTTLDGPIRNYFPFFPNLVPAWMTAAGYLNDDSTMNDLLNLFDKFAECTFGLCNLAVTALNKKAELEDKLSLDTSTGRIKAPEALINIMEKEEAAYAKIEELQASLDSLSTIGT
jgi:hypothetical protein